MNEKQLQGSKLEQALGVLTCMSKEYSKLNPFAEEYKMCSKCDGKNTKCQYYVGVRV